MTTGEPQQPTAADDSRGYDVIDAQVAEFRSELHALIGRLGLDVLTGHRLDGLADDLAQRVKALATSQYYEFEDATEKYRTSRARLAEMGPLEELYNSLQPAAEGEEDASNV